MSVPLLTVKEVSEILRVHPLTIRRMVERGDLIPVRIPGLDRVLFDPQYIDKLIQSSKVRPAEEIANGVKGSI